MPSRCEGEARSTPGLGPRRCARARARARGTPMSPPSGPARSMGTRHIVMPYILGHRNMPRRCEGESWSAAARTRPATHARARARARGRPMSPPC